MCGHTIVECTSVPITWSSPGPPSISGAPEDTQARDYIHTLSFTLSLKLSTQSPLLSFQPCLPIPKNPQSGSDSVSSHLCISHQSCLTLCDLLDCSPWGSSAHGTFQARILEWVVKVTQTPSLSASPSPPCYWKLQYPLRLEHPLPGREPSFIYPSAYFPVILQCSSSILCMAVPYRCPFLPLAKLWDWHLSPHLEGGRRTPSFITILF